jgi:AcrR family transcriptional regulator
MKKTENTKDLLITSAGELFAEFGFKAVSTRMISDRAEVKLSAIHYHFGSKENLYIETCLTAYNRGKTTTFRDVVDENPNLMNTPEGQAEIVRTTVFRNFHDHFKPARPEWETKIIVRELTSPGNAMRTLVEKTFKPDAESSALFYKKIKPDATDIEASTWSDLMYGKILLYSMAKQTIEMVRGENCMTEEYFQTAAAKLARAMILEAGLPLPADLV